MIYAVDMHIGVIKGTVFDDANANGVMDAGEGVLAGYKVFIDRTGDGSLQHQRNVHACSIRMGSTGSIPGSPGRVHGAHCWCRRSARGLQVGAYRVTLADGAVVTKNFGRTTEGGFSRDRVYMDANKNGTIDNGESGMIGWTVFIDANGDGSSGLTAKVVL